MVGEWVYVVGKMKHCPLRLTAVSLFTNPPLSPILLPYRKAYLITLLKKGIETKKFNGLDNSNL